MLVGMWTLTRTVRWSDAAVTLLVFHEPGCQVTGVVGGSDLGYTQRLVCDGDGSCRQKTEVEMEWEAEVGCCCDWAKVEVEGRAGMQNHTF